MINLYHGDCLEVMKDIPDNSIDLIVSDIPYKIISGGCTNDAVKITGGMLIEVLSALKLIKLIMM